MKSLIRHIFLDKSVATMLLISSFIIGICALAPAVYVIIVLNKYLASGVTATLLSLSAGAIMMLIFEFLFRFRKFFEVRGRVWTSSDLPGCVRMRSDAFGSVRAVAFVPHTGEATGAENLRTVRSQAV